MKWGVIVFPGSNCDSDCYYVIRDVLDQPADYIWHDHTSLEGYDCLVIPGGFSYGDYLRTGAIAARSPVVRAVEEAADRGKLVLGICNGFQILCEAGLLPGALRRNRDLKFECGPVHLRVENVRTPFTSRCQEGQVLTIPIAHGEGNYHADEETLADLKAHGQVVFRYCTAEGLVSQAANPNGSIEGIAGLCNRAGNVLGLMPHPERASEAIMGSTDGRALFESALAFFGRSSS